MNTEHDSVVVLRVPSTYYGYALRCGSCEDTYSFGTKMMFCTEEDNGRPDQYCAPTFVCPACVEKGRWVPWYDEEDEIDITMSYKQVGKYGTLLR